MNELYIPKTALGAISELDKSAGHVKPAGIAMGIDPSRIGERTPEVDKLQFKDLPDGTSLMVLDTIEARIAISSLAPGAIIDLFDTPSIKRAHPAVIIRHDASSTIFWSAHKLGDAKKSGVDKSLEADWDEYEIDGMRYSEADATRLALADLYSLDKGAEGTQMLGNVYSSKPITSESSLAEVGHSSHETPAESLKDNIVLGNTLIRQTTMQHIPENNSKKLYARIRRTDSGIAPIRSVGVTDEERVQVISNALMTKAESLAASNPAGFGAETEVNDVFDVMVDSLTEVAEDVGSGITASDANKKFNNRLSKISKSF